MATENGLWGAPRIHGELMKLGITVSERTVSRYLPDRRTRRSQTWRTFFANHVGNLAFASTVTSPSATGDDDVEASVLRCRFVPPSHDERYFSNQWGLIDWPASLESTSLDWGVAQTQVRRHTHTLQLWKGPAERRGPEPVLAAYGWRDLTFRHSISADGANAPPEIDRF
jgi:hypothetical protein